MRGDYGDERWAWRTTTRTSHGRRRVERGVALRSHKNIFGANIWLQLKYHKSVTPRFLRYVAWISSLFVPLMILYTIFFLCYTTTFISATNNNNDDDGRTKRETNMVWYHISETQQRAFSSSPCTGNMVQYWRAQHEPQPRPYLSEECCYSGEIQTRGR